jgi:uncharacterized protein
LTRFRDGGAFFLYINEERVATTGFEWSVPGVYRGTTSTVFGLDTAQTSLHLVCDAPPSWKSAVLRSPVGEFRIARLRNGARIKHGDRSAFVELQGNAAVYDENSPPLLSQFVRMYDRERGGAQTFPVLLVPGTRTTLELQLERQAAEPAGRGGFRLYRFKLAGLAATLWVDEEDRICLLEAPERHSAFVRAGYESLRSRGKSGPPLSEPVHTVKVNRNAGVPMRDGVRLATDIYEPEAPGRYPVILVRTPYGRGLEEARALYFSRRGYIVAVQDVRGRFGSGGAWNPYRHERKDGYDAVEFFAQYKSSNGKVGMMGGSYLAWTQWWAAIERPPGLVTIISSICPPDPYEIHYQQGVFFLAPTMAWVDLMEDGVSTETLGRVARKDYARLLRALPVIELDRAVKGRPIPYWRDWALHPANDEFWRAVSFSNLMERVRIPVFHQSGWFDYDGLGTKLNYLRMRACGHSAQKLVIGPWLHTEYAHRRVGQWDFGPAAVIDLQKSYLRWFDHLLKGIENGTAGELPVSLFVMGANQWRHASAYPLPETRYERWYLAPRGRLSKAAPSAARACDRYVYDPADPTPDPEFAARAPEHSKGTAGGRKDILVYITEPLRRECTIAGPMSAVLYAFSSAPDTDWHVRLLHVSKDGRLLALAHGTIRARFRHSTQRGKFLQPGRIYRYDVDLWHTAIRAPAGSRFRIEIASACFPTCSRNLNTGDANETSVAAVSAHQTIYRSRRYPSHIVLPVVPSKPSEELKGWLIGRGTVSPVLRRK